MTGLRVPKSSDLMVYPVFGSLGPPESPQIPLGPPALPQGCPQASPWLPWDPKRYPKGTPMVPKRYSMGTQQVPKFQGLPPKMFFGHNLHLMAPFELIPAGFCIIFRRASFMFLDTGAKSGPNRAHFWPGPFGLQNQGSKKVE